MEKNFIVGDYDDKSGEIINGKEITLAFDEEKGMWIDTFNKIAVREGKITTPYDEKNPPVYVLDWWLVGTKSNHRKKSVGEYSCTLIHHYSHGNSTTPINIYASIYSNMGEIFALPCITNNGAKFIYDKDRCYVFIGYFNTIYNECIKPIAILILKDGFKDKYPINKNKLIAIAKAMYEKYQYEYNRGLYDSLYNKDNDDLDESCWEVEIKVISVEENMWIENEN
jgi:hypothetical protein